jgi:N-acetylglutamate synthase-like GNAT family acetyltransferase
MNMLRIDPVTRPDRGEVRRLLACLDERYPAGLDWLERRLDDVEVGRAWAWRAGSGRTALGFAITTPKGKRCIKLCTLYVAPAARGFGIGRGLLQAVMDEFRKSEVESAFVTVDEGDRETQGFFAAHSFSRLNDVRRAYNERFDIVYASSS